MWALYGISPLACQKINRIFQNHITDGRNFLASQKKNSLNHVGCQTKERSGEKKSKITLGLDHLTFVCLARQSDRDV